MIKLKDKVNKSAMIRELKQIAEKRYAESWQPELQEGAFIDGAEALFKLLRLGSVSNSSTTKKSKEQPTPYSEWVKKLKDV